jgi:hypothetical protein
MFGMPAEGTHASVSLGVLKEDCKTWSTAAFTCSSDGSSTVPHPRQLFIAGAPQAQIGLNYTVMGERAPFSVRGIRRAITRQSLPRRRIEVRASKHFGIIHRHSEIRCRMTVSPMILKKYYI